MSNLRCIIVEDEPLAAKVLKDYIDQVPFLELKGSFKDAILATDFLRENTVDLIFLDIHLPRIKGLAFLKMLAHPPAVIITTAYHQYAVEGFNLNVTDYLLKPFEFERFLQAVSKVRPPSQALTTEIPMEGNRDHLLLSVQKKKVRIPLAEILYIESQREYVKVVTSRKEYVSKISTGEIESLLPVHQFRRIHRSYIVALSRIDSFSAEEVEINGIPIPIGRDYKGSLKDI